MYKIRRGACTFNTLQAFIYITVESMNAGYSEQTFLTDDVKNNGFLGA